MNDCAETLPEWAFLSEEKISVIPSNLKTLDGNIIFIQIRLQGLQQWSKISPKVDTCDALQGILQTLGYSLLAAAKCRIAKCLYQSINEFSTKMSSRLSGKAARDCLDSNKVYELCTEEAEIRAMLKVAID